MISTAKFHRRRLGTGFPGHMDEVGWRQEGDLSPIVTAVKLKANRRSCGWAGIDFVWGNSGWELTT